MISAQSTPGQRLRVGARIALGKSLEILPLRVIDAARRRHVAVPILRHRSLANFGTVTIDGDPAIELVAIDSRLLRSLYWYGETGHEGYEVYWWRHFCRKASEIVEIGANIGYYTIQGALAAPSARYTAVDAHPESVELVRRNLSLNHITNVDVVHAAVVESNESPTVELSLPALEKYAAPTGAFVDTHAEGVGERRAVGGTITVPAIASPEIIGSADLVKVDAEGSEHQILGPVVDSLLDRRATVVVEVLRKTPRLREHLYRFADAGYELWSISGPRIERCPVDWVRQTDDLWQTYGIRDVAVVPGERTDIASVGLEVV